MIDWAFLPSCCPWTGICTRDWTFRRILDWINEGPLSTFDGGVPLIQSMPKSSARILRVRVEDGQEHTTAFRLVERSKFPMTTKICSLQPSPFVFPGYRRTAPSDPIADQIHFDPSRHRVVFVEGEYLLLGKGGMVPGYATESESNRWRPLLDIFDSMWFISCQNEHDINTGEHGCFNYDFEEQRRRRILYHLEEDEDDKETIKAMFPSFSCGDVGQPLSKEDVATKRIDSNDVLNMLIAETCKEYASLVIRSI